MLIYFAPMFCVLTGHGILLEGTTAADFSTFLQFATSVLTWMLTSFTSIVTWMLANPIAFWGLVVSVIGTAFVYLRSTIGG